MPLTQAQTNILQLAVDNGGIFDPTTSTLRGGALNKVISALQNKKLLNAQTQKGYRLSDLGFDRMATNKPSPTEARKGSKTDTLIKLLRRKKGATSLQIQTALSWQAHSVRGVISGTLKKKMGFVINTEKNKAGDLIYKIVN